MTANKPVEALDPGTIPLVGTTFIEASAGTGKTYALTTLYLRLIVEQGLRPADILVVTFTQAATAELRERIRSRIRDALASAEADANAAPLRRALQTFDEAAIFTIHGFCQRTLQENAFESGLAFDAELVEKPDTLKRTLAHDLWTRLLADEDESFREWLAAGAGRSRWSFEPESLFQLIHDHLGADETMPVLPEPVTRTTMGSARSADSSSTQVLCAAADAVWLRFAESWAARREAVTALLLDPKVGFNGNKYRPDSIQKTWIPELDALCLKVEQAMTPAVRSGLAFLDFMDKLTVEGIATGVKKGFAPPGDPFFAVCSELERATAALGEVFDARALALRRSFVDAVWAADRKRRDEQHVLFFDDLLSQLRDALAAPGGDRLAESLRQRHRFALIDEFQDTDAVQYEIFERVWHTRAAREAGGGLVLIGDPKQAIYSFRGADIHTYLAARRAAGDAVHSLAVNHRSDPPVIAAVNALFGATRDPFAQPEIEFRRVAPAVVADREPFDAPGRFQAGLRVSFLARKAAATVSPDAGDEAGVIALRFARTRWMQAVARDVAELLESGATIGGRPIAPSDIAVLARRKSELDSVRRALEALGIPSVSRGEGNVFDSREAWELSSVLAAWLRPGDFARLRAALSSGAHGFDAHALASLGDDSPELTAIAERFAEYGRIWSQSGFSRAFETWRAREGVSERLLAYADGDRRLTNWLHLAELLARIASERGPSRTGLVAWLDRATLDEVLRLELGTEASLLRLERDDEAVQLVTLHASKGLEYEIVYLPCLWETFDRLRASEKSIDEGGRRAPVRFHDPDRKRRTLDLGVQGDEYKSHLALEKAEASAEHLRLLYVGLTRAKHQCVVFWGCAGNAHTKSPLARLLFGAQAEREKIDATKFGEWLKNKKTDDDGWRAAWRAIADAAAPGAISIEDSDLALRDPWRPLAATEAPLEFEAARPLALRPLATTSFSALVRGAQRASAIVAGPLATGRDLDAEVDLDPQAAVDAADLAGEMQLFPRGTEAGTLLHEVLERSDFAALDESAIRLLAEEWLGRSGLGRELAPQVVHVVRSVAHTPLRIVPRPFRLADVAPGQLLPELEFTLAAPGDDRGHGFSAAALARILATAPTGSPLERYAERAASLSWPVLAGCLRGFIDAVFSDGERYFVIDYKSNHLGARQRDYRPERLVEPMIQHDYVLQYLLYTVAVDRHLASRLADYDYERDFGGAYYLFLRGMAEGHEPGCGIFFDRPDAGIVRRVSELLGQPGGEGR